MWIRGPAKDEVESNSEVPFVVTKEMHDTIWYSYTVDIVISCHTLVWHLGTVIIIFCHYFHTINI